MQPSQAKQLRLFQAKGQAQVGLLMGLFLSKITQPDTALS